MSTNQNAKLRKCNLTIAKYQANMLKTIIKMRLEQELSFLEGNFKISPPLSLSLSLSL